jgi:hypothetical protein
MNLAGFLPAGADCFFSIGRVKSASLMAGGFFTASDDGVAGLWDVDTGNLLPDFPRPRGSG